MPKVFISHAAHDNFTCHVRDLLYDKLDQMENIEPLLDRESIGVGEDITQKVAKMLRECHAAVLLFGPDSMTSKWMKFEANVLGHRNFVDNKFLLIPAFVGEFEEEERKAHLELLMPGQNLGPRAVMGPNENELSSKEANLLAQKIADCFKGLDYAKNRWMLRLASLIREIPDDARKDAAESLADSPSLRGKDIDASAESIAYHLAEAEFEVAAEAICLLLENVGSKVNIKTLVEHVLPLAAHPDAALRVLAHASATQPDGRVFAINSTTKRLGKVYAKRACFDCKRQPIFVPITGIAGEGRETEIMKTIEDSVWQASKQNKERGGGIKKAIDVSRKKGVLWFMVLDSACVKQNIHQMVRAETELDAISLVLLGGRQLDEFSDPDNRPPVIEPRLTDNDEEVIDCQSRDICRSAQLEPDDFITE